MNYYIGVDPGKHGGFCLLTEDGEIMGLDIMPLDGEGQPCPVGISNIYRGYNDKVGFDDKVTVIIEKVYTHPDDAKRKDGRLGVLNYALGAGRLEMCVVWGWEMVRVHPKTWMAVIKRDCPKTKDKKERKKQSERLARALWGSNWDNGDFVPERCRTPHDGLIEAALVGEWGRIT